jgi:hypothetical protein
MLSGTLPAIRTTRLSTMYVLKHIYEYTTTITNNSKKSLIQPLEWHCGRFHRVLAMQRSVSPHDYCYFQEVRCFNDFFIAWQGLVEQLF